ncbi:lysis system i-spanin subunit Rz [Burkholderia cenocepacia]|uniref:lysis system i-spanin subunit Rz n=1 Tax=Burkholderia cenocepacia TaxID=95486 RepID=UPI000F5B575D|nr:lysis system i-spanin subunit Rz [Burkholderia cenocepacia]RQU52939.1 lysozyme [Burkholderia cenocepacia]RQV35061.1 lysozyme [Burkholderia cenocepacia]
MLAIARIVVPYILAALVGAILAVMGSSLVWGRRLALEQAVHAQDRVKHEQILKTLSERALQAQQSAMHAEQVAQSRVAQLDEQLTQEQHNHEADNRRYRSALASGAERVRVAIVRPGNSDRLSRDSRPARLDDGAAPYADLDPTVARRIFKVAGDDQHEIDKLRALQAYVCAVRLKTVGCTQP